MKEVRFKILGRAPLLIHSNKAANPLNYYAKALKHLTSKRKKTDQDYEEIARLEWEAGLYLHKGIVQLPAQNFERCFWDGAKKSKNGKLYQSGAMVTDDYVPLKYDGPSIKTKTNGDDIPNPELDPFYEHHRHQAMVKVGAQQVLRTRPIFHNWSCEVGILFDNTVIDERAIVQVVNDAGRLVGMCEMRPRMGRFEAKYILGVPADGYE